MKNKVSVICFWAMVSLVLVYLAVSIVPSIFTTEGITVQPAQAITHDDVLTVTGIALRDEVTVIASTPFSSVDYSVSDGDRVSKGDVVARYSSGETTVQDRFAIESIDRQISLLNECLSATSQHDLETLDSRTKDAIGNYLNATTSENLSLSLDASTDVVSYFIKRDIKAKGDKAYYGQILSNCEAAKSAILTGNSASQTSARASRAGYFSSQFDGYETYLSSDYSQADPSTVKALLSQTPHERPQNYIGKLQHFSYWHYLCTIPEAEAEQFSEGSMWTIRFNTLAYGAKTVSMTVAYVSSPQNGEVSIIFESSFFDQAIYSLRICDAEIILKSYSGFRIRKDSIRVSEGQNGVYVLSGAKLIFKPVAVIYRSEDSDFAVVVPDTESTARKLILNDSVVVGGKEIYDGKVVNIN